MNFHDEVTGYNHHGRMNFHDEVTGYNHHGRMSFHDKATGYDVPINLQNKFRIRNQLLLQRKGAKIKFLGMHTKS